MPPLFFLASSAAFLAAFLSFLSLFFSFFSSSSFDLSLEQSEDEKSDAFLSDFMAALQHIAAPQQQSTTQAMAPINMSTPMTMRMMMPVARASSESSKIEFSDWISESRLIDVLLVLLEGLELLEGLVLFEGPKPGSPSGLVKLDSGNEA